MNPTSCIIIRLRAGALTRHALRLQETLYCTHVALLGLSLLSACGQSVSDSARRGPPQCMFKLGLSCCLYISNLYGSRGSRLLAASTMCKHRLCYHTIWVWHLIRTTRSSHPPTSPSARADSAASDSQNQCHVCSVARCRSNSVRKRLFHCSLKYVCVYCGSNYRSS